MDNHVHFVLAGRNDCVMAFFALFRRRLARYCAARGYDVDLSDWNATTKLIATLRQLRNTVAYANRNGFVVNPDCTPFTYEWSTGRFFFNNIPSYSHVGDLSVKQKRELFKCRNGFVPDGYLLAGGHVHPESFCDFTLAYRMFRNAHHYFSLMSKNVESFSDIAREMSDGVFMTDEEVYSYLIRICAAEYKVSDVGRLSAKDKLEMARRLHYECNASNGQIRRLLRLKQEEVDEVFPSGL